MAWSGGLFGGLLAGAACGVVPCASRRRRPVAQGLQTPTKSQSSWHVGVEAEALQQAAAVGQAVQGMKFLTHSRFTSWAARGETWRLSSGMPGCWRSSVTTVTSVNSTWLSDCWQWGSRVSRWSGPRVSSSSKRSPSPRAWPGLIAAGGGAVGAGALDERCQWARGRAR